jgi:L-fuconolactonase
MSALIDSHHHFFDPIPEAYPWMEGRWAPLRRPFGPDELAPLLLRTGVTATVLVQTQPSLEETEAFLELAASISWIQGVVGWIDLQDSRLAETISWLEGREGGCLLVGVRHDLIEEADDDWLRREDVRRGLKAVADSGLVFDLLMRERHIEAALDTARAFPELRFVIDHLAKPQVGQEPRESWLSGMRHFATLENVACKISGLMTEADWERWTVEDLRPFVESALGWFQPSRCMFGSDWPVCTVAASYETVVAASKELFSELREWERDQVLGTTALNWYALS